MMRLFRWTTVWGMLCFLVSCSLDDPDVSNPSLELFVEQQATIAQYLDDQGIDAQQAGDGVYYQVLRENPDGRVPERGNVLGIYYQITQLDGTLIDELDSTSGAPLVYTFYNNPLVRENNMISPIRMDASVAQMREGEIYRFFLPSEYAYRTNSLEGVFPSEAIIIVEIQLAEVLTQTERIQQENERIKDYLSSNSLLDEADSLELGVYYAVTQPGNSPEVSDGSTIEIRYTGSFLDGTVFDSNIDPDSDLFRFVVGSGRVIPGFEIAALQMQQGERGTVIIPSRAAYGEGVIALPYEIIEETLGATIPPYSILRFDLEVVSVQ